MRRGFVSGVAAAAVAGAVTLIFRMIFGAPTLPEWLVDWATSIIPLNVFSTIVDVFGGAAKILLVIGLSALLVILGGVLGILFERLYRRANQRPPGWRIKAAMGLGLWLAVMGLAPYASHRGFFALSVTPWPVALAAGWFLASEAYSFVLGGLLPWTASEKPVVPEAAIAVGNTGRRRFLKGLGWTVAGLAAAAALGTGILKLVSLAGRKARLLRTGTLTPEVTPNEDFYVVSKNFSDPQVDAVNWKLTVTGLVEKDLTLDYEQLKSLPGVTQYLTLECISNPVGGEFIGNALWKGVRLRDLLDMAGIKGQIRKVVLSAEDGYSDSITLDKAMDPGCLLAYEMNGVPLPNGHGFPVRLLVPNIFGMKNVKWITKINLVDYDYQGYWQERGWSDDATIKTMSRIDGSGPSDDIDLAPFGNGKLSADQQLVSGIAFAGERGVSQVEVSTDGGKTWSKALVKNALSSNTWVLWVYPWTPPQKGDYTLRVRATDGKGGLQSAEERDSLPDGASGHHEIVVRIT